MDLGLKDKVALVTGAGSPIGFGRAISTTLAQEGCDIIVNDINLKLSEQTASQIEAMGRQAMAVKADVTNSIEVNNMVKEALDKFGKIDILINNAGITAATTFMPYIQQNEDDWDRVIDINLKGTMICAKAVLPDMLDRRSGKIINISSSGAIKCPPSGQAYCASKAGVIAFTQCLALEVISSGIYVNCIAPGSADTNLAADHIPPEVLAEIRKSMLTQTPAGKATTPQDIANMVAYLVSDIANDIVGQTITIDGGITIS